jgi:hypothetical protein
MSAGKASGTGGIEARQDVLQTSANNKGTMYGTVYGVKRTTIYLPADLKKAIEREASRRGLTQAEIIREAVGTHLELSELPKLDLPLFDEPLGFDLAGRVDELLEGMGEDR